MDKRTKLTKAGMNAFTAPFRWILATGLIYFEAAGDTGIPRAWIYIATYALGSYAGNLLLIKKVPELLNQRGKIHKGTRRWDKTIVYTYFFVTLIALPLTAGLDYRFRVSTLPFYFIHIGIVFFVLSLVLSIWAMLHNPFFEPTVRIQEEKGHRVTQTGPYIIIRHPGNLGMLLGSLPIPFAFGSLLSFIPAVIMIVLVIIRTYKEDKTLLAELAGYREYATKVKYRLIPHVW